MQFIPGTWRSMGVDGDGDGVRNPQDIDDAAMSTGVYLCSGKTDLSKAGDLNSAVLRYNHSQQYVDLVVSIAKAYAGGSWIAVGNGTEDDDQGVDRAGDQIGDPADRRPGGRQPAAGDRQPDVPVDGEADAVDRGPTSGKPTTEPTKTAAVDHRADDEADHASRPTDDPTTSTPKPPPTTTPPRPVSRR